MKNVRMNGRVEKTAKVVIIMNHNRIGSMGYCFPGCLTFTQTLFNRQYILVAHRNYKKNELSAICKQVIQQHIERAALWIK